MTDLGGGGSYLMEKRPDFVGGAKADTQLDTQTIGSAGASLSQAVNVDWANGMAKELAGIE